MLPLRHFRDQFLHHHIQHGTGCKAEQIGQCGHHDACRQNRQHCPDGLYDAGQYAAPECPAFFHSFCPQGHGDNGSLREVLDGNAKGKCQRPGGGDLGSSGKVAGIDHAHCHTLRDVVQRHRQNHHGGALELAFWPFGLQTVLVQMRDEMVQQQQKQDAQPETHRRREKRQPVQICGLFHGWDQQAPYRCRHHDSGGEAGQRPLDVVAQGLF